MPILAVRQREAEPGRLAGRDAFGCVSLQFRANLFGLDGGAFGHGEGGGQRGNKKREGRRKAAKDLHE